MRQFLESLSSQQRQIFLARYWDCLTSSQIAKQFGLPRWRVNRMLKSFRGRLGADAFLQLHLCLEEATP